MYREGITSQHHGVAQAGYSFPPTSSICVCVDVYGRDFSLVLLLLLAFPLLHTYKLKRIFFLFLLKL